MDHAKSNATRQSEFRHRQRNRGLIRVHIWMTRDTKYRLSQMAKSTGNTHSKVVEQLLQGER